jgi:hypothetical protein
MIKALETTVPNGPEDQERISKEIEEMKGKRLSILKNPNTLGTQNCRIVVHTHLLQIRHKNTNPTSKRKIQPEEIPYLTISHLVEVVLVLVLVLVVILVVVASLQIFPETKD